MVHIIDNIYYERDTGFYYDKKSIYDSYYYNPLGFCLIDWKVAS